MSIDKPVFWIADIEIVGKKTAFVVKHVSGFFAILRVVEGGTPLAAQLDHLVETLRESSKRGTS